MGISPKGRPQTESIPMGSSSYSRSKVTRDALSYPQGRGGGVQLVKSAISQCPRNEGFHFIRAPSFEGSSES